jgi:hypothetical protein
VKSFKAFRFYVLHLKIISYVPSAFVKDILIHPDIDERIRKWIARILEFDLEIKPTKLFKGQGLAKLLVESNCKYLEVNFINTCSENQQEIHPASSGKHRWILTTTDYFTKWIEVVPTSSASHTVIISFLEDIIVSFGCPNRIIIDNAASFKVEPLIKFYE